MIDPRTIEFEGGYVWHPRDFGGPTAFGVTAWTYAKVHHMERPPYPRTLEQLAAPNVQAFFRKMEPIMMRLTKEEALKILEEEYVTSNLRLLPEAIRGHLIDISINAGHRRAGRILQGVLVAGGVKDLKVDGLIGPNTLKAVEKVLDRVGPDLLNDAIAIERAIFYVALNQPSFQRGWLRRAAAFAASEKAKKTIMDLDQ